MPKKLYHTPLQDIHTFIKNYKNKISNTLQDNQKKEYYKTFSKAYYDIEIEKFIHFYKIDSDISHALKTINFFKSQSFLKRVYELLNFEQFDGDEKELFYIFLYFLKNIDNELFEKFIPKLFLHFFDSNKTNNININYKEIAQTLSNQLHKTLKESFAQKDEYAYFKLILDEKEVVSLEGKSIKTMRKKAYKIVLDEILGEIRK